MREASTKIKIILEGNSIPNGYSSALVTALNTEYGVGNYDYVNVAGNGERLDEIITNYPIQIQNNINGFANPMIVIIQEIRNQLVFGSTPTETYNKFKDLAQGIRSVVPSYCNLQIVAVTAIADNETGADIDTTNQMLRDDVSGDFDLIIDLYNHSTFNDYTSSLFDADETHMNNTGKTVAGNFIAAQLKSAYP